MQPESTLAACGQGPRLFQDAPAELPAQQWDGQVGRRHGNPAIGRQRVVGDATVALAPVGFRDAQRGHSPPPKRGGGVVLADR